MLACLLIVVSEVKFIAEGKEVSPERSSSTQHQANGGGHTGGSPKAQAPNESVLVHLKLDALGFNGLVCDEEAPDPPTDGKDCNRDLVGAKTAPIEQPNYTFLRLNSSLIQLDLQNPIDLYNSWPSANNS